MKLIPLTQNKFTSVDDSDFDWLNQWKWHYMKGYATRRKYLSRFKGDKEFEDIYMHRLINETPIGIETDHKDFNKLNNQKDNLRIASRSQNMMNTNKHQDNTSGYKGVYWHKQRQKWWAKICINYKNISLGLYKTIQEAIVARNLAEERYFKEFRRIEL